MSDRFERFRNTVRLVRARSVVFALAALFITAGIATYVGVQIHAMTKETMRLSGELNVKAATIEYNRYLLTRMDVVGMVGNTVEDLLESGADADTIEKYLMDETDNIVSTFDPTTTGLYGWINGEYVDGSGWVPDDDYVATERPWYTKTVGSKTKITLVDPYLDAQTESIMMTVSMLLDDGQSVLAMDVSLDPIQRIIEQESETTKGGQAFLLDAEGVVVAHSDFSQLGRNYLEETDTLCGIVAHKLFDEGQMQFEVETPEGDFSVYTDKLEGGWYSVSLINGNVWHRPLHRAMLAFAIIIAIVVFSIIAVFFRLTAKNIALQELHTKVDREEKRGKELKALSETDRMTGLNDRVSGERKVTELLESGSAGMFLELDIDHFKEINDTFGHQAGDRVILAVADALRGTFRTNDVTMRLGGDEFGVFAVGLADAGMGEAIVHRLFHRLESLEIEELNGEKVCISVGAVLSTGEKKRSFSELYALADDALYISKKTPGNCLTFGE